MFTDLNSFKDKVSVVIPVYNSENFLNKSIESVINQTYTNIEIFAPCQPHGHQGRFCARAMEPEFLDGRYQGLDGPRPTELFVGGRAQMGAPQDLLRNCLGDLRAGVSQKQRAMAGNVVDVFISVHVPLPGAGAVGHEQRKGHGISGIVGHASREKCSGFVVPAGRSRMFGDVLFKNRCHATSLGAILRLVDEQIGGLAGLKVSPRYFSVSPGL